MAARDRPIADSQDWLNGGVPLLGLIYQCRLKAAILSRDLFSRAVIVAKYRRILRIDPIAGHKAYLYCLTRCTNCHLKGATLARSSFPSPS